VHQDHKTEYKSETQKKVGLIINAQKFYNQHGDLEVAEFFRLKRKTIRIRASDKCNNNCLHCSSKDKEIDSTEDILNAIKELPQDYRLVLSGAEPTLREDYLTLVRKLAERGHLVEVETNGRAFSYLSFAQDSISAGAKDYLVYVYGHNADVHDSIVGVPGAFNQMTSGIMNLESVGAKPAIQIVLTEANQHIYKEIFKVFNGNRKYVKYVGKPDKEFVKNMNSEDTTFIDTFFACVDVKDFGIDQLKGCPKCPFVDDCRGRPWEFFR